MPKQNERAFQNFLKDNINAEGGYVTQLHPGIGSDTGIPDLMTAVEAIGLFPLELKIGSIDNDHKTLWCSSIRPTQIAWHYKLTSHGYLSAIVIGVPNGNSWRVFLVESSLASKAKGGFIIGEDATEIDPRFITTEFEEWAKANYFGFEE